MTRKADEMANKLWKESGMINPMSVGALLNDIIKTVNEKGSSITQGICIPKPIGCGGPAKKFRNALSTREFQISGFCQKCQDKVFGED